MQAMSFAIPVQWILGVKHIDMRIDHRALCGHILLAVPLTNKRQRLVFLAHG